MKKVNNNKILWCLTLKNLSIDAKELDEEETKQDEDWGNPPSPDTPETAEKR